MVFQGLILACENESLLTDTNIRLVACYDNEEVSYALLSFNTHSVVYIIIMCIKYDFTADFNSA